MIPSRTVWYVAVATGLMMSAHSPAQTTSPAKKTAPKKNASRPGAGKKPSKSQTAARRRKATTRNAARRKSPAWAKLVSEQQALDMKIQAVDRRLRNDAELEANRKVLQEVIRKRATANDPGYAKLKAELNDLRTRIRQLQAKVTAAELKAAQDPAVARLQESVNRQTLEKGNSIDPNYGQWVEKRNQLRDQIRKLRRSATGKKKPSRSRKGATQGPRKRPRGKTSTTRR